MNLKKTGIKFLSILLVMVALFGYVALGAYCADTDESTEDNEKVSHALVITSESLTVTVRKKIQLEATVTNTETQPEITWTSLQRLSVTDHCLINT